MKRRSFIQLGATGALFGIAGLTFSPIRQSTAANHSLSFFAESYTRTLVDGSTVTAWRFNSPASPGPGNLGSGLVVREGDSVTVVLTNNLDRAINFTVPGVSFDSPACNPGSIRVYTFTAPSAGSYFYCDGLDTNTSNAMGLAGPLVVMPASSDSSLFNGGPLFDRQYTLLLNELDSLRNVEIAGGQTLNKFNFEPNYFFVNGLSYPETRQENVSVKDTEIVCSVGEDIAIRFINTGLIANSMHFHGYHVDVITRNRIVESNIVEKDTVLVRPQECVDVILSVVQAGTYPVHNHFVPAVTANGVYANGALLMVNAS